MAIYMFSEMFRLTVVAQRENLIKNGIHTYWRVANKRKISGKIDTFQSK